MSSDSRLKKHEWGAVILYISLLASLTFYTQIYIPWRYPSLEEEPHWLVDPKIDVYVTGAVRNRGLYRVNRGSSRGDLLTDADPTEEADLSRIRTDLPVKQGDLLEIPFKKMITIRVKNTRGELLEFRVEKGTKVFELEELIGVDSPDLKKKRPLKDGETVIIKEKGIV